MDEKPCQPEGQPNLEDAEILRELGICAMPAGQERALKLFEMARKAKDAIAWRAEGLQSLDLDEKSLELLAAERGQSLEETRAKAAFFRDVEKDPWEDLF